MYTFIIEKIAIEDIINNIYIFPKSTNEDWSSVCLIIVNGGNSGGSKGSGSDDGDGGAGGSSGGDGGGNFSVRSSNNCWVEIK